MKNRHKKKKKPTRGILIETFMQAGLRKGNTREIQLGGPNSSISAIQIGDMWQVVNGENEESIMKFCIK